MPCNVSCWDPLHLQQSIAVCCSVLQTWMNVSTYKGDTGVVTPKNNPCSRHNLCDKARCGNGFHSSFMKSRDFSIFYSHTYQPIWHMFPRFCKRVWNGLVCFKGQNLTGVMCTRGRGFMLFPRILLSFILLRAGSDTLAKGILNLCVYTALHSTVTHCDTLQRTATISRTLQYTATHCNALQCTAAHCNAL